MSLPTARWHVVDTTLPADDPCREDQLTPDELTRLLLGLRRQAVDEHAAGDLSLADAASTTAHIDLAVSAIRVQLTASAVAAMSHIGLTATLTEETTYA